jgi:hypothetical protein
VLFLYNGQLCINNFAHILLYITDFCVSTTYFESTTSVILYSFAPDSNQLHVSRFNCELARAIKYRHKYGFTQLKGSTAKIIKNHIQIEL